MDIFKQNRKSKKLMPCHTMTEYSYGNYWYYTSVSTTIHVKISMFVVHLKNVQH